MGDNEVKVSVYCSECHQVMALTEHGVTEEGEQILAVKPCATGCVDLGNILANCLSFHGTDETDDDGRPLP